MIRRLAAGLRGLGLGLLPRLVFREVKFPVFIEPDVYVTYFFRDIRLGKKVYIGRHVELLCTSNGTIKVGENVYIGAFSKISAHESIEIGNCTMIAERVSIYDSSHIFDRIDIPIVEQGFAVAPVIIGHDCWIGAHTIILPGVSIGDGAVIGAGSVVVKDIPAYSVAAGVPARILRSRD